MNESANPIIKYFSEFKILKTVSKDFWLTNVVQFFDGMAYFSLITVFVLYLTDYCSFNDADAALWVGLYTLFISAFVFAVGSICDIIGIRRTYLIGFIILIVGRLIMGFGPDLSPTVDSGRLVVMTGILIMSFGTAFMSPVIQTSIRRFAPLNARATGFNIYYLLMNIAAVIANVFLIEFFRKHFGAVDGGYWIINFGTLMVLLGCITTRFIDEDNYAEPSEKEANLKAPLRRPLQLFREVWKESAFRKLILFLVLTMGVRIVFTLQFLVMPKYYVRTLYDDFAIGSINAINPAIIVSGLILLIPVLGRFSTVSLMIVGMSISAFSLVFMAIPIEWYYVVPGIETRSQAYLVAIVTQILVFAFGELLFSPRFSEYVARVAPKDKVASYMSLAALPMFIAKPINGIIGGLLVAYLCYDGICAKMDTGHIGFWDSPEFMWTIYLTMAVISPIAIILTRKTITSDHPEEDADSPPIAAIETEMDPAVTAEELTEANS